MKAFVLLVIYFTAYVSFYLSSDGGYCAMVIYNVVLSWLMSVIFFDLFTGLRQVTSAIGANACCTRIDASWGKRKKRDCFNICRLSWAFKVPDFARFDIICLPKRKTNEKFSSTHESKILLSSHSTELSQDAFALRKSHDSTRIALDPMTRRN